jgi:heterodisulfide reductase subunit A-like polyferredoxin
LRRQRHLPCGLPYGEIEFVEETHESRIVSAVCKACDCCTAACASGAIRVHHTIGEQIFAPIEAVIRSSRSVGDGFAAEAVRH